MLTPPYPLTHSPITLHKQAAVTAGSVVCGSCRPTMPQAVHPHRKHFQEHMLPGAVLAIPGFYQHPAAGERPPVEPLEGPAVCVRVGVGGVCVFVRVCACVCACVRVCACVHTHAHACKHTQRGLQTGHQRALQQGKACTCGMHAGYVSIYGLYARADVVVMAKETGTH